MFAVIVEFDIKSSETERFLPLMVENAQRSLTDEPGCTQFDVWTDPERPDHVFLYEVYDSEAAFQAHLNSPHFQSFDQMTREMIASKSVLTKSRLLS